MRRAHRASTSPYMCSPLFAPTTFRGNVAKDGVGGAYFDGVCWAFELCPLRVDYSSHHNTAYTPHKKVRPLFHID